MEETVVLITRLIALACFVLLFIPVILRVGRARSRVDRRARIGTAVLMSWCVYIQVYSFITVALDYSPWWGRAVASTYAMVAGLVCAWSFWPFNRTDLPREEP